MRWLTAFVLAIAIVACNSGSGDQPAAPTATVGAGGGVATVAAPPAATATRAAPTAAKAVPSRTPTAMPPVTTVPPTVVPPTATATSVPPSPTATPEPPTATSIPPTPTPEPPTPTPGPSGDQGEVVKVVDGDTLDVVVAGTVYRVRIIGVDTPETVDPNSPVMCYGAEATAFTKQLVNEANGQVLLEKDISETDRYDRLLRYVWLQKSDGLHMLNWELVNAGMAQVSTYPPDVKYVDQFLAAQQTAQANGVGLWGACDFFGEPVEEPTPTPAAVATEPAQGNCDPSYPSVCIPPYPPDLDCGDIPFRRFEVLPGV